jgi:hypothetical protein
VLATTPANSGTTAEIRRSGGGAVLPADRPSLLLDPVKSIADDARLAALTGKRGLAHVAMRIDAQCALRDFDAVLLDVAQRPTQAVAERG